MRMKIVTAKCEVRRAKRLNFLLSKRGMGKNYSETTCFLKDDHLLYIKNPCDVSHIIKNVSHVFSTTSELDAKTSQIF